MISIRITAAIILVLTGLYALPRMLINIEKYKRCFNILAFMGIAAVLFSRFWVF
jgi:hypothetical protein